MAVDTMFQPSGGAGGGSSGDYVKDHFQDTSRPATDNSSLSSGASVNPLGFFFNNTDTPQYGLKTLYVKDLVLLTDTSKWIDDKPTYEVIFNEYLPSVRAYAAGNVRLRNATTGKVVELRSIGDVFGVTGMLRQIAWIAQPSSEAAASANTLTDGAAVSTITFQNLAPTAVQGTTKYNVYLHNASPSTNNIHDYRLTAVQAGGTLDVAGILAYFDAGAISLRPGQTYSDKVLVTTTVGSTQALASISGRLGGNTVINKNATGAYVQTTAEPVNISSVGTGSSGTNLINVTTGTGASFGAGFGVACSSGSSQYFGIVTTVSTDTLTVTPTLPFGVSGTLFKLFSAGATYPVSATLYSLSHALDPLQLNNALQTSVFGATLQGEMAYSDPRNRFTVFSKDLQFQNIDGYFGLGFEGNTSAFLQVDGRFCAAEFEFAGNGIFNGTFSINGVPAWGMNTGFSGVFKKTIFTDGGPSWNSFVFVPGTSHVGCPITKINLYNLNYPVGVTAGVLASYESFANTVDRGGVQNATIMQLGAMQRVYADQLTLTGAWTRGVTHTAAGGVFYGGASTNSALSFQYFGKDFALVGTAGGSMVCTLDGASISSAFNSLKSVPSMTWHTVSLTYVSGATCVINAVDYIPPSQNEFKGLQKVLPLQSVERIQTVFEQTDTPRNPKSGDVWIEQKLTQGVLPRVWMYLYGYWNRIYFDAQSDDPKLGLFIRAGGSTTNLSTDITQTAEIYNGSAWQSFATAAPLAMGFGNFGDNGFNFGVNVVDRIAGGSVAAIHQRFNLSAWASQTNRGSPRVKGVAIRFGANLFVCKGSSNGADGGGTTAQDIWSGSAWSSGTAFATAVWKLGGFVVNNILSAVIGSSTGGSNTTLHETKSISDTLSSATAFPITSNNTASSQTATQGLIIQSSTTNPTTTCYAWSGSAWAQVASTINSSDSNESGGCGTLFGSNPMIAGGYSGGAALSASSRFNGTAWVSEVTAPSIRSNYHSGSYGR